MDAHAPPIRFLRLSQVIDRVGLRKSQIYDLEKRGQFPRRVPIHGRATGWVEEEVTAFQLARIQARDRDTLAGEGVPQP